MALLLLIYLYGILYFNIVNFLLLCASLCVRLCVFLNWLYRQFLVSICAGKVREGVFSFSFRVCAFSCVCIPSFSVRG